MPLSLVAHKGPADIEIDGAVTFVRFIVEWLSFPAQLHR